MESRHDLAQRARPRNPGSTRSFDDRAGDRRTGRHGARGHLGHARCRARRHRRAEAVRDRHLGGIRFLPPLPRRDRRPERHARVVHNSGTGRHEGLHPDLTPREATPRRHGAVHLGPSAGLPHLRGERGLRAPGHGGSCGASRGSLRLRRRQPLGPRQGREQSLLHLRRLQVHRLLALRAGLRGDPGNFRPYDRRPRLRLEGRTGGRQFPGI